DVSRQGGPHHHSIQMTAVIGEIHALSLLRLTVDPTSGHAAGQAGKLGQHRRQRMHTPAHRDSKPCTMRATRRMAVITDPRMISTRAPPRVRPRQLIEVSTIEARTAAVIKAMRC